jgi:DNA-directed RNA polymerase beta subunit
LGGDNLNIINPIFKIQDENNIFNIRKKEYENILPLTKQILEPVKEIGFEIVEVDLKDSRFSSGELSKTIKQSLIIKIQKGPSIIDLSMFIPKLVDDNYIVINRRRKVPLFQLFDIPIVTRGDSIKLRTNVATLMVVKQKDEPYIYVSFLGKKVPLALLMMGYYGSDVLNERFELDKFTLPKNPSLMEFLVQDLKSFNSESVGYTQDDFIHEIGRLYSKYNAKSKGYDIMYALDLIPKVDIITARFLTTGSIIEELLLAIESEFVDDTLFTNKRVRCFEYLLFSKLSKIVFDLCFSNRTSKQPKFNINSTQLLSECNVSEIVQFDFSINPIEELTKLSRISLLGPGGFKRENIPKHLRDICPTMFGRVCPVDTPDRDNCGVLQNLIPNVLLDENLKFSNEYLSKQPVSIPVSMIPFLEHDDQTRLQMASSQMRQAILLKNFDEPMIKSGCEHLYTDYTQFIKRAKKDGEVIHMDNKYIIVVYSDSEVDVFDIEYRAIYVEHMDFMNIYVKPGDKFKAGEILAESNFCKNGHIVFGKNLLAGVMVHYGNNYEDGIVISDRLVNDDSLTSVHYKDLSFNLPPHKVLLSLDKDKYKPLPNAFETINVGQPYAIIKSLSSEELYSVFNEELKLEAEKNFIISEVKLFANSWNEEIPEFQEWVDDRLKLQQEKEKSLAKIIKDKLPKDIANRFIREKGLDLFSFVGKYKNKREKINGIHVQMIGVHFRKIKGGDKVANRHGNKGVISRIVPHEKMPKLEDGRHLDICINPLGSISRMNIGQLYELHLSMSLYDLKQNMIKMLDDSEQELIKQYLVDYIKIIDQTKDKWYTNQFTDQLPNEITKTFIEELTIIQPPFESCKLEDVENALNYTGTKFKQKVYDPLSKVSLKNEIATGYIYFFRMVHIAEEKLAARGIGTYAKRTLQPLGGRKNKGGQRCGEMETACLIGHDAPVNLFEFLTTKSDCIDLKNQYIRSYIDPDMVDETKTLNTKPESVKLLNSYLTVIGVDQK